jgi:hypothetical protein
MTLTAMELLRRFVQHVLPRGFVRIRQFGYLANTCRTTRLTLARRLLRHTPPLTKAPPTAATWCCPRCGAPMVIGPILTARQLARALSRLRHVVTPRPHRSDCGTSDVWEHAAVVVYLLAGLTPISPQPNPSRSGDRRNVTVPRRSPMLLSTARGRSAASFKSRYRKCLGISIEAHLAHLAPRHFR